MSPNCDPCTHPLTIRGTLIKRPKTIGEDGYGEPTPSFEAVSTSNVSSYHTVCIVAVVSAVLYLTQNEPDDNDNNDRG